MEVSQEKGYVWIGTRSGIERDDVLEEEGYDYDNPTKDYGRIKY
jgi:hypothetical protein